MFGVSFERSHRTSSSHKKKNFVGSGTWVSIYSASIFYTNAADSFIRSREEDMTGYRVSIYVQ